jgi:hypothetical protein
MLEYKIITDQSHYSNLKRQLQQDFSALKKIFEKNSKKSKVDKPIFNVFQQEIYNYITTAKKSAILKITREDKSIINVYIEEGDEKKGLKHILLRHYGKNKDGTDKQGEIFARDILNFTNVIKFGRELTDAELNSDSKELIGFSFEKNKHLKKSDNEKEFFKVFLLPQKNGSHTVTFFCADDKGNKTKENGTSP